MEFATCWPCMYIICLSRMRNEIYNLFTGMCVLVLCLLWIQSLHNIMITASKGLYSLLQIDFLKLVHTQIDFFIKSKIHYFKGKIIS